MSDDKLRSRLIANLLSNRDDMSQRRLIDEWTDELDFDPIDELMISVSAWEHVLSLGVEPKAVFAHPEMIDQQIIREWFD